MSESTGLLAAMLAFKQEAPKLRKDQKATVKSDKGSYTYQYIDLWEINEKVDPVLAKHELVWSSRPSYIDGAGPSLKYRIAHVPSGEKDEGEMLLLLAKSDPQAQGSALTYARRYAKMAVLDLVADEDDDGAAASGGGSGGSSRPASEKQVQFVQKLLKEKKLTAAQIKLLLTDAGVKDTANVVAAVGALTGSEASKVIDALVNGPVKTGESDVPSAEPGEFEHPPAGADETLPFDPGVPQ